MSFSAFSQNINHKRKIELVRDTTFGEIVYTTIDSVRQGLCIAFDSLGRKESESCYVDGEWTGPFIIYYPNGTISSKCYMVQGVKDGTAVEYYPNGSIESIKNFKRGMRHGIYEEYVEDGRLDKRFLFRNDTLISILEDNHQRLLPPGWEPFEKD